MSAQIPQGGLIISLRPVAPKGQPVFLFAEGVLLEGICSKNYVLLRTQQFMIIVFEEVVLCCRLANASACDVLHKCLYGKYSGIKKIFIE